MSQQFIETTLEHGVLKIILNRPDVLNSFNYEMAEEVQAAFKNAETNDEIRCVLLTANGKAFCAGQDLKEVTEIAKDPNRELSEVVHHTYNPIIKAIRNLEKPVVCAVNGTAAGAGANIALACDMVLASVEAKFIQSFSNIGLIPDSGGTYFLPRLIGLARATELTFTGRPVKAPEAVDIGMIYKSVVPEELMQEATELCEKFAQMPTRGFGLTKKGFNAGFSNDLNTQLDLEADLQAEAGSTEDYNEGVQAFLEKRKPAFKGK
ncbi:MAG: 2-(1,2-epoxy-1,2-dihydrophenyl)acetyl-CoA isomerase [Balneola sp.]